MYIYCIADVDDFVTILRATEYSRSSTCAGEMQETCADGQSGFKEITSEKENMTYNIHNTYIPVI